MPRQHPSLSPPWSTTTTRGCRSLAPGGWKSRTHSEWRRWVSGDVPRRARTAVACLLLLSPPISLTDRRVHAERKKGSGRPAEQPLTASHPLKFFTIHGLWLVPAVQLWGMPSCCRPITFDVNKVPTMRGPSAPRSGEGQRRHAARSEGEQERDGGRRRGAVAARRRPRRGRTAAARPGHGLVAAGVRRAGGSWRHTMRGGAGAIKRPWRGAASTPWTADAVQRPSTARCGDAGGRVGAGCG
nr:uncharacterized protein LOC4336514 isoform X2 [Oryza sativa Japonica Group]